MLSFTAYDDDANNDDVLDGDNDDDGDDDDEVRMLFATSNRHHHHQQGLSVGSTTGATFLDPTTSSDQPSAGSRTVAAIGEPTITFAMSPWSTPCMIIGQYMYNCHSRKNNRAYWRCHNYSKKQQTQRCRARCVIANGCVQAMTGGEHNHAPHTAKIEKIMSRRRSRSAAAAAFSAAVAAATKAETAGGASKGSDDASVDGQKITFLAATQLDEYAADKNNMIIFD